MAPEELYGRPRGNGEPDYFGSNDPHMPTSSSQYNVEPREASRQRASSILQQPNMTSAPDRTEPSGTDVSPELIAAITERVKKELVEHLKQTGNVDEQPRAPSLQRAPSNNTSSTSSPPPTNRGAYTPPSPTQPLRPATAIPPPMEPVRSPPSSPLEKPSGVRFSDRTMPNRPGASRTFSTVELSTIDQKWGRLFDSEGRPTTRLGQFLRGLANHIIEDFPPKRTIVVTPAKMALYYTSHALETEIHPLVSIFRAQSNEQISKLYQDLGCQHHLIQDQPSMAPVVPALTPVGFAHWMTIHILAYPEEESKRLEKVVLAMPIDADGEMVDGKPERLPKQISRHLLPEKEDRSSRKLIENAITNFYNDLGTSSRRKASITSPSLSRHSSTSNARSRPVEIHQVRTSPPTSKAQPIERERNPYAGVPSVTSESSGNEETIKIERDRQPYTAQPGNGKVYTENPGLNALPRLGLANSTSSRPRDMPERTENRHHRTQSTASQNYVPPPRAGGRRTSSPPIRGYSISTPDDIDKYKPGPPPSSTSSSFTNPSQGFIPSSYSSTSSIPPPPPPVEIRDSRERRVREDRHYGTRRGTEEEAILAGEFNSPRDAERWDRFQESRAAETDRLDRSYEGRTPISTEPRDRGSVSVDPRDRDSKGLAYEDWYREPVKSRGAGYDSYTRY